MVIYRKTVKRFGDSGHVVVSKRYIDEEAIIVMEDELDNVKNMFAQCHLIDSVKDRKMIELGNELKDVRARLGLIERHLTSLGSSGKKSNGTHTEPQSAASEPSA